MVEAVPAIDCCDVSEQNPAITISEEDSFQKVISYFSKKTDLHRVFVTKSSVHLRPGTLPQKSQVIGLLTQSRVLQFLHENKEKIPETILHKKVSEWYEEHNTTFRAALEVTKPSEIVFLAFRQILTKEITGTAIVDDSSNLIGSLSTSDLKRSVAGDFISDMQLTVQEYLNKTETGDHQGLVTCTHNDEFHEILRKFVKHEVHRIFVLNQEGKPVGVISLCDVITLFK